MARYRKKISDETVEAEQQLDGMWLLRRPNGDESYVSDEYFSIVWELDAAEGSTNDTQRASER